MYSEHIVAYIDILGFRETVLTKTFDIVDDIYGEFNRSVKEGIKRSLYLLKPNPEKGVELDVKKVKVVYFSDCVIWSYPTKDITESEYFAFLIAVKTFFNGIQNMLFNKEIATRGGISIGNLYLNENKIFGSGLVKAYELEKKAKYPRILIDEEII